MLFLDVYHYSWIQNEFKSRYIRFCFYCELEKTPHAIQVPVIGECSRSVHLVTFKNYILRISKIKLTILIILLISSLWLACYVFIIFVIRWLNCASSPVCHAVVSIMGRICVYYSWRSLVARSPSLDIFSDK